MSNQVSAVPVPLTVKLLAIWTVVGIGQGVAQAAGAGQALVAIGVGCLFAYALLRGHAWVYTVMLFGAFTSCLILIVSAVFFEVDSSQLITNAVVTAGSLLLLMHPKTRAFAGAGIERKLRRPQPVEEPSISVGGVGDQQPQGVRRNTIIALIFLLTAIAIAGTLGVIRIYQMSGG